MNPIDGKECTWTTHHRMGVSVGCIYDYLDGDYKVYFASDLWEMADRLNRAALVVGFNILGFDDKLLAAMCPIFTPASVPRYDMLLESRYGIGWKESDRFPSGLKLDNHLLGTFGRDFMKTYNGAEAPWLYRTGQQGKLVNYNVRDVRCERTLFEYANANGEVKTDTHGLIKVRSPEEVMREFVSNNAKATLVSGTP